MMHRSLGTFRSHFVVAACWLVSVALAATLAGCSSDAGGDDAADDGAATGGSGGAAGSGGSATGGSGAGTSGSAGTSGTGGTGAVLAIERAGLFEVEFVLASDTGTPAYTSVGGRVYDAPIPPDRYWNVA